MTEDVGPCCARRGMGARWQRRGPRRHRRGVSDVVATILLLALTVVLFSAIFAFVTSFPSPPAQSSNQFQATLFYKSGSIAGLNITHLAGPQIPSGALVYVKSAGAPTQCFSGVGVTVGSGISTSVWTLGQTWYGPWSIFGCTSGYVDSVKGDNLTVFVLNQGNVIFSALLPGQAFASPPTFLSSWTSPSPVLKGAAFKVYTTVSGNLGSHKPYISLAGILGYSGSTSIVPMWYNSSQSAWQYNVTGANSTNATPGTYYGIVNVTGSAGSASGLTATTAVSITISPAFGVAVSPSPPTFKKSTATATTFVITLTNFGSFSGTTVNVSIFDGNASSPFTSSVPPFSNGKGGWWVTPSTAPTIGAYSTLVWAPILTSPSITTVTTYTFLVSVTLKNSSFGSTSQLTITGTATVTGG